MGYTQVHLPGCLTLPIRFLFSLSGSLQPYCCRGPLNGSVCPCPSRTRAPVFRAPRSAWSPLSAPAPFGRPLPPPRWFSRW
eukprot:765093-Pyramimonas_sp.AAC.1